jgi:hypothetical protein
MAAGGVELIRGLADAVDGGAKRLRQKADGIRATIVNGQVLLRDNELTGNLPASSSATSGTSRYFLPRHAEEAARIDGRKSLDEIKRCLPWDFCCADYIVMADLAIPDFVSDPPLTFWSGEAAGRWLEQFGVVKWPSSVVGLPLIERLAAALDASEDRIDAILFASDFRHWLKRALLGFDPIPHETEARSQFVHLSKVSFRFLRRHRRHCVPGRRFRQAYSPRHSEMSSRLEQRWAEWDVTWSVLEARNPILELQRRMGEVFDSHDFNSWWIGGERLFEQWLARGTREPMPFFDHRGIVTDTYYRRLCELRTLTVGSYYWSDEMRMVVYAPMAKFRAAAPRSLALQYACESVALGMP